MRALVGEVLLRYLRKYLRYGHHEALMVYEGPGRLPAAMPIGVRLTGRYLVLPKLYRTSRAYNNLKPGVSVSLVFTSDSKAFFEVLFKRESLRFREDTDLGFWLIDADFELAVLGLVNTFEELIEFARVRIDPVKGVLGPGDRLALSRANYHLVEALIYLTKVQALRETTGENELRKLAEKVMNSLSMVEKLGSRELRERAEFIKLKLTGLIDYRAE